VELKSIVVIIKNGIGALLSWIPKIKDTFRNKNIPSKTIVIVDAGQ
jgi:hypothetical protein